MSDRTITIPCSFLKEIDQKLKKYHGLMIKWTIKARHFNHLSKMAIKMNTLNLALRYDYQDLKKVLQKIDR